MTKKRFVETLSTGIVTDTITGKEYKCEMRIDDDLLELLNELHEENKELQRHLDVMRSGALTDDKRIKELYDENEQLKTQLQNTSDQRDEFHRGARENANCVGKLEKENERLKQEKQLLYENVDLLKRFIENQGFKVKLDDELFRVI